MEYSHEIIVPNDDLPFKMFIFEGSQGGYIRQKHWHRSIYFSHSPKIQDKEVKGLFEEMYHVYVEKTAGYEYKVHSLYYRLLYLLVSKYRKTDLDTEKVRVNRKLNKLSTITDYMKQNYSKELSLESLARTFNYSPTYLSRMFRKYAQMSYKTYLDDLRLRHAYNDLMNTELSIGMVAEKNGFAGSKAFTRVFKEQYGVLPSEYRKKNQFVTLR